MLIRYADEASDAEACAAIYAPFVDGSPVSFEEVAPSAADFAARIEWISRTHPWLVAEVEETVVGFAYACPHRERAAYRWAADVTVYVNRSRHRSGVGRALYRELFERLSRQGFRTACAGITLPNDASVGLHEACGFRPVGVYRRIGWKAGAWRDVGWWQLELAPPSEDPPPDPRAPVRP